MSMKHDQDKEAGSNKADKKLKAALLKAKDGTPAPNAAAPAPNAAALPQTIARRREAMAMSLGDIQTKYYAEGVLQVPKTNIREVGFSFFVFWSSAPSHHGPRAGTKYVDSACQVIQSSRNLCPTCSSMALIGRTLSF